MSLASHVVPALLFSGAGVAFVVAGGWTFRQWRHTGEIPASFIGWAPFGSWQTLASVIGWFVGADSDGRSAAGSRFRAYTRMAAHSLLAIACFAGALEFARTGHGF